MNAQQYLELEDSALLGQCEVHTYRSSGPGGQHRNKTSSAVRLHHQPTRLIAKGEAAHTTPTLRPGRSTLFAHSAIFCGSGVK